jgi:hydroxymethylbilane synthase
VTRIRIGTRGSALALWQAREIAARLAAAGPGVAIDLVEITSTGDTVTDLPLAQVEGTGFFTASIERALAGGEVDVAVHSHKDLPVETAPGLIVAAVPMRGPIVDVLCARDGCTLATLPRGARIGTCSTRRTAQVLARRPDLDVQVLRGNVPTRVARIAEGRFDAVVLAHAGLQRLGLEQHITEVFSLADMLPAPAQGALAVQCREADHELRTLLSALDHAPTRRAVQAERAVLHGLGGGCSVPVGATAIGDGDTVTLTAAAFAVDGTHAIRVETRGADPDAVGAAAARQLLAQGAGALLAAYDRAPRLDAPTAAEARS